MKKYLIGLVVGVVNLSVGVAAGLYQDTATPFYTPYPLTRTPGGQYLGTETRGYANPSYYCPEDGSLPDGWGTITPDPLWEMWCGQCIPEPTEVKTQVPTGTGLLTITPSNTSLATSTRTNTPTSTPNGGYYFYPSAADVYDSYAVSDPYKKGGCWSYNSPEEVYAVIYQIVSVTGLDLTRFETAGNCSGTQMYGSASDTLPAGMTVYCQAFIWGGLNANTICGAYSGSVVQSSAYDQYSGAVKGGFAVRCSGQNCATVGKFHVRVLGYVFKGPNYIQPTNPNPTPTNYGQMYCGSVMPISGSGDFSYDGFSSIYGDCFMLGGWADPLGLVNIPEIATICWDLVTLGTFKVMGVIVSLDWIVVIMGAVYVIRIWTR